MKLKEHQYVPCYIKQKFIGSNIKPEKLLTLNVFCLGKLIIEWALRDFLVNTNLHFYIILCCCNALLKSG